MSNVIYVLHKNGADSHYQALKHLLQKEGGQLYFREFSVFGTTIKSILKLDFKTALKQLVNCYFLFQLLVSKNKKVVLGIAPYDKKLGRLLFVLKNHQVYYHTSWANWDGTFVPKSKKVTPALKQTWKNFIEEKCDKIFTVTEYSKQQLVKYYSLPTSKIFVVKHSFDHTAFNYTPSKDTPEYSFIYVGRLIKEKGIEDLLSWFSKNTQASLTLVGKGDLEDTIKEFTTRHTNISYKGYISDKSTLTSMFATHNFMILNSYKTHKWEELFGMVLIEGMACGLIPVASNHVGPKSIVNSDFGYIFEEGAVATLLDSITSKPIDEKMKLIAVKNAAQYTIDKISNAWEPILK